MIIARACGVCSEVRIVPCVLTVSLPGWLRIEGKRHKPNRGGKGSVPKPQSWRSRIGAIILALERTDATVLDRSDVETLFQLQRRAALRLMERIGPTEEAGEWRIDRIRLLEWLKALSSQERDEDERSRKVRKALQQAEQENRQLRAELRKLGRPDPASWTVSPEVFSARMSSLPEGVRVGPGLVSVSFPPEDPILGAKKLHQLSLAMLNDWESFAQLAGDDGPISSHAEIESLSTRLEQLKQQGVDAL
jgi:hypothetical protein